MDKKWVMIPDVLFFQEGPGVRNSQYTNEGVKLINVANLVDGKVDLSTSDRYISEDEAYGKYSHFLCDEGDFIVASSGIKVEYIDKKMGFIDKSMLPLCMNTSTIRFKVLNPDELRIRYFMYYLKSMHFKGQLFRLITGSAQLNYGPSHLKQMQMPLIDIGEQDKIINRLDRIQRVIEARQQELLKFDELIKARFVELFGDKSKYRVEPLNDNVEEMFIGPFGSALKNECFVDEIDSYCMVYEQKHAIQKSMNLPTRYVDEKKYNELKRFTVIGGDVIVSCRGTIGEIYSIPEDAPMGIMHPSIMKIRLKREKYGNLFFVMMLEQYMQDSMSKAKGSGVKMAVTATELGKELFVVPDIEEQIAFETFVKQVDKSKVVALKAA